MNEFRFGAVCTDARVIIWFYDVISLDGIGFYGHSYGKSTTSLFGKYGQSAGVNSSFHSQSSGAPRFAHAKFHSEWTETEY